MQLLFVVRVCDRTQASFAYVIQVQRQPQGFCVDRFRVDFVTMDPDSPTRIFEFSAEFGPGDHTIFQRCQINTIKIYRQRSRSRSRSGPSTRRPGGPPGPSTRRRDPDSGSDSSSHMTAPVLAPPPGGPPGPSAAPIRRSRRGDHRHQQQHQAAAPRRGDHRHQICCVPRGGRGGGKG